MVGEPDGPVLGTMNKAPRRNWLGAFSCAHAAPGSSHAWNVPDSFKHRTAWL